MGQAQELRGARIQSGAGLVELWDGVDGVDEVNKLDALDGSRKSVQGGSPRQPGRA